MEIFHKQKDKLLMSSSKQRMLENIFMIFMSAFMEIIHIKLSNERLEIAMLEISRKNFLSEIALLLNNKRFAIFIPANYIKKFGVLKYFILFD